jgi:hypothetical protein
MNTYAVNRGKGILLFVLIILGVFFVYRWAKADSNCTWTYNNGHYVCVISGSDGGSSTAVPGHPTNGGGNNQGGSNKTGNNGGKQACTPTGQATYGYVWKPLNYYVQGKQQCEKLQAYFDSCGNVIPYSIQNQGMGVISDCTGSNSTPTPSQSNTFNKCSLVYDNGSISCSWNFQWRLVASVTMPPIVIDTRPYPVTLVSWPTTMRVNSLATNSGSGRLAYAGWGGGRPGNPRPGDWENITLTVTFRPTGNPVTVNLAQQPPFTVSASAGGKKTFTWMVASHPAVGAVMTAGQVGQLSEIPGDMTLFQGNSMTTYRLFYTLTYQEYSTHTKCGDSATPVPAVPPAIPPGSYQCKNLVTIGEWNSKSENGEIPPGAVQNLPASINGGSVYNDYSVVIRRMDESGSTSNPAYAHEYSWGSIFWWGCREGQGQIGWPAP